MVFATALLDKPAPGWKYDLPSPNQVPSIAPYPPALSNSPNHVNNIYLEMPRSIFRVRGVCVWGAIALFFLSTLAPAGWILFVATEVKSPPFFISFIACTGFSVLLWIGVYFWRMDIEAPRDEPIRFNRIRRKIYVYRFHHDGRRPFSRTAWGVRPEVYNWDDLRAEACSVYGPMGTGGLIETVTLAVVKPGTNNVIDRFHFAHDIQQGEMYWAMAQLFMQQGPQALPTFPRPPRD